MSEDAQQFPGQPGSELIGQIFDGKYEITQVLGQGGMATVYLANQTSIGRTVAVKVLPPQFTHDPMFIERFRREVQVITHLQHPRILPVYDYGTFNDRPYIVMAYMEGATLSDRMKEGPMPIPEVVRLVEQIAEGLAQAHREGIIHRDFKPSNVLLDKHGNAYLADFGIAKVSESTVQLTGSGIVGTPAYMSPEMIDQQELTPSVDIYALGVSIYQMLTGEFPFQADTPLRVLMAHATDPVPNIREVFPDLPEGMTSVIYRAMAKRPEERYATAPELAAALKAAAEGKAEEAVPEPAQPMATMIEEPLPVTTTERESWQATPEPTPMAASTKTPPAPAVTSGAGERKGCSRRVLTIGLIVAAVVVVCGGGLALLAVLGEGGNGIGNVLATETPLAPPEEFPTDTAQAPPTEVTPEQMVEGVAGLDVVNLTAQDMCELYVFPIESDDRGDDWLAGATIPAGSTSSFENLSPDEYMLIAEPCQAGALKQFRYGLKIPAGERFRWEIAGQYDAEFTIFNESSEVICYLYIGPLTEEVWGPDQFGDDQTIDPAGLATISMPEGTWDVLAETCDGEIYWEEYDVSISGSYEWTLTDAEPAAE